MSAAQPEVLPPEKKSDAGRPGEAERTWAMACHLAAFAGYIFPFGHLFGPLAVWLFKGETFSLVADQGRESLNFQISMTIYVLIAGVLVFAVIGLPLLALLSLFHIVVTVVAAVKAKEGKRYRYPLTIRFFR